MPINLARQPMELKHGVAKVLGTAHLRASTGRCLGPPLAQRLLKCRCPLTRQHRSFAVQDGMIDDDFEDHVYLVRLVAVTLHWITLGSLRPMIAKAAALCDHRD